MTTGHPLFGLGFSRIPTLLLFTCRLFSRRVIVTYLRTSRRFVIVSRVPRFEGAGSCVVSSLEMRLFPMIITISDYQPARLTTFLRLSGLN